MLNSKAKSITETETISALFSCYQVNNNNNSILQCNYLLFVCRVNSYKANYRQHSVYKQIQLQCLTWDKKHIIQK
jgi:hypothetical protein